MPKVVLYSTRIPDVTETRRNGLLSTFVSLGPSVDFLLPIFDVPKGRR